MVRCGKESRVVLVVLVDGLYCMGIVDATGVEEGDVLHNR